MSDYLKLRIMFLDEIKQMFKGYIEIRPQHKDYYESVIIHLDEISIIYQQQLAMEEKPKCPLN